MLYAPLFSKKSFPFTDYVRLSQYLPSTYWESGLNIHSPRPETELSGYIQDALDDHASEGKVLVWDKAVRSNKTLRFGSNTDIYTLPGKGCVMGAATNVPMFMNKNVVFRENDRIIDENIHVRGGIWHGNGEAQTTKGGGEFGLANLFSMFGIRNYSVKGARYFVPQVYCQQAINIVDGLVEDFTVNVGSNYRQSTNRDGIHFDGWCKDCTVRRGNIHSWDDGVACNADDFYYMDFYGDGVSKDFWTENPCGPSSGFTVEDIYYDNSTFGIRILSSTARLDDFKISNVRGRANDYGVLIDNFWRNPGLISPAGAGNIGKITIDDMPLIVNRKNFFDAQDAKISLSCSIEELIMTGITENLGDVPTFKALTGGTGLNAYDYGIISLNGEILNL